MLARVTLTPEENDFYRTMLYRVTSSPEFGQPALRRAFIAMIPVSVLGSGTMSIDEHWRVYIDFKEMMARGLDYACGILNHEIWHVLREHHKRMDELPPAPQGYDKNVLANLAEDLEINDDIEELLPATSLMPGRSTFRKLEKYKDRINYYKWILENLPEMDKAFPDAKQPDPFEQKEEQEESEEQEQDSQEQENADSNEENSEGQDSEDSEGDSEEGENSEDGSGEGDSQDGSENGDGQDSGEQGDSGNSGDSGENGDSGDGQNGSDGSGDGQGQGQGGNQPGQGQGGQGQGQSGQQGGQPGQGGGQPGGSGNGQPGQGQSGGAGQEQGNQQGSGDGQPQQGESGQGNTPAPDFWTQTPKCGGAAGNAQDYEFVDGDGNSAEGSEGVGEGDQQRILDMVAKDIEEFLAKGIGNEHGNRRFGNLADWAEKRKKSKYIPWKQELRGNFKMSYSMQKGKMTYDRSRPSRRQPVPNIMFPAMRAPRPKIGIAFDVSGSNLGNLRLMVDELVNIMKSSGVRGEDVQAFAVDTKASDSKIVKNPLKVLDNLVGGGGTRMTPGYEKLAELGNDVSILVTDGYVDDYPTEMPKGKGKKRSKYITCVILEDHQKGDPHDHHLIKQANEKLGKWGKVIPIVVTQQEMEAAGY